MRFWRRISRYDPNQRDARGAFVGTTWTSITDVGEEFDGNTLTLSDYTLVENAYVDAMVGIGLECGVDELEVRNVDVGEGLSEGAVVDLRQAKDIVRRMLREEVICALESPAGDLVVHVGFDLYMYVGSSCRAERAIEAACAAGLYVDDNWPSPQSDTDPS